MKTIRASADTADVFPQMMTYSDLNKVLGIEHYHALWDKNLKYPADESTEL